VPVSRDPEPLAAARRSGEQLARRQARILYERMRTWVSRELLYLLGAAVATSATAVFVLPALAAVACGLVSLAALVVAVFARRLMHGERARRRWAEVATLRERERAMRAEDALDVVALGLAGDPDSRAALLRDRELWQAVRALEDRLAQAFEARRPLQLTAEPKPGAPLSPPDIGGLRRRRAERHAGLSALRLEIRALEDPTDAKAAAAAESTRREERAARQAALAADRRAREEHRRADVAA